MDFSVSSEGTTKSQKACFMAELSRVRAIAMDGTQGSMWSMSFRSRMEHVFRFSYQYGDGGLIARCNLLHGRSGFTLH